MHSVVVLGDVRTHCIPLASARIPGGALMTEQVIRAAFGEAYLKREKINIFGYAPHDLNAIVGEERTWNAGWHTLSGSRTAYYRLDRTDNAAVGSTIPAAHVELDPSLNKALLPKQLFEPKFKPKGASDVIREKLQVPACPDVVVFRDMNRGFRDLAIDGPGPRQALSVALETLFERFTIAEDQSKKLHLPLIEPVIICAVAGNPSSIRLKKSDGAPSTVWTRLAESEYLRERTIILLDAEEMRGRSRPLAISTGLSWERTAQDTIFELLRDPEFRPFLEFGQVVVRYGVTGALHVVARPGGKDWSYTLLFNPEQHDRTWTSAKDGVVLGKTSVFIASMVKALDRACRTQNEHPLLSDLDVTISKAIDQALRYCRQLNEISYGSKVAGQEITQFDLKAQMDGVFKPALSAPSALVSSAALQSQFPIAATSVPPVSLRNWSILSQSSSFCIQRVARKIVRVGVDQVLNCDQFVPAIAAPVVKLGKKDPSKANDDRMIIVDRREIEGCRAIEKLMVAHLADIKAKINRRPLCFAVFGPPGSGKSTAVKKIIEHLDDGDSKFKKMPSYNLSQFSQVEELHSAFADIANASVDDQIPVAFFDEFDSRFQEPLGWLKMFLAPMEDGVFGKSNVKNAILVFAGGTSPTFSDFSLENRPRTDDQWIEFSKAKGPDFVSRLRGHLNVVGINPADSDDELYMIRRAILIRSLISEIQGLKSDSEAQIDTGMLRALLHVPEYRHGGRAVRMLLDLCQSDDHRVSVSAVPPIHQLNMLVDGKAFQDLLNTTFTDD